MLCVSHQVGPSSPVEEESIWVNLQGDQRGGPAVRLLDEERDGGIREMDTTVVSCVEQRAREHEKKAGELMFDVRQHGKGQMMVEAGQPSDPVQFISSQSDVYRGELV